MTIKKMDAVLQELKDIGAVTRNMQPPVKKEVVESLPSEVKEAVEAFNEHLQKLGPALDGLQKMLEEIGKWADEARKFAAMPVPPPKE